LVGDIAETENYWIGPASLDIDATVFKTLNIRYRITSSEPLDLAYFYWIREDDTLFGNDKKVKINIQTDEEWHEAEPIDLALITNWNGVITGIRLYPAWYSSVGTQVEYDYIRLCK